MLIDPVSAGVLGELPEDSIVRTLQDLHYDLLGGRRGRTINGVGAAAIIVMGVTGIWLWWPGRAGPRGVARSPLTQSAAAADLGNASRSRVLDGGRATSGDLVVQSMAPLHVGTFGGPIVRWIWFAGGLAPGDPALLSLDVWCGGAARYAAAGGDR